MASITKTFQFATDTERWVAVPGTGVDMAWQRTWKKASKRPDPPLSIMGGSLRCTAPGFLALDPQSNYWRLDIIWEDLGVPVGAHVTGVSADYLYRWYMKSGKNLSIAEFNSDETYFGPFELRNKSGELIDTFSDKNVSIDRHPENYWKHYPEDPNYPYDRFPHHTQYPITEIPPAWGLSEGGTISLDHSSDTAVQFWLCVYTPGSKEEKRWFTRMKVDHIVIEITYDPPISGTPLLTVMGVGS